jgi:hypothetical protein
MRNPSLLTNPSLHFTAQILQLTMSTPAVEAKIFELKRGIHELFDSVSPYVQNNLTPIEQLQFRANQQEKLLIIIEDTQSLPNFKDKHSLLTDLSRFAEKFNLLP